MTRRIPCMRRLTIFLTHWLRFPRCAARSVDCGNEREIFLVLNMAERLDFPTQIEQRPC